MIFQPHSAAKKPEFRGQLSKIFSESKSSFSGSSLPKKPLIQCGLSTEKKSKFVASFLSSFCCQEAQISRATLQDFFQVKVIIFRLFSAQETIYSVWPINRKKFQVCGLFFVLILLPRSPNFGGHFPRMFPTRSRG